MGIRNRQEGSIKRWKWGAGIEETDPGRKELEVRTTGAEAIPGRGGAGYPGSDPGSESSFSQKSKRWN